MSDDDRPQSYYGKPEETWVCVFPGKMGISWKLHRGESGTKAEAEERASKYQNVIAIPLALWLRYREYEQRSVVAERKLMEELSIRMDYVDGNCQLVQLPLVKPDLDETKEEPDGQ